MACYCSRKSWSPSNSPGRRGGRRTPRWARDRVGRCSLVTDEDRGGGEVIVVSSEEMEILGKVGGEVTMLGLRREEEGGGETAGEGGWAVPSSAARGGGWRATWGGNWSTGSCCCADNDCPDLEPGGELVAL